MSAPRQDDRALKKITASEVRRILKGGRAPDRDWVDPSTPLSLLADTLAAMANESGGLLLIGVAGIKPEIIGVPDTQDAIDRVLNAALMLDPPLIVPLPRTVTIGDQTVIAVQVPRGMPHVYAHHGRYLRRQGSANEPVPPGDLRRLLIERGEISFEAQCPPEATLDEIDWDKAALYVKNLGASAKPDSEQTLLWRGCLSKRDSTLRPTHAGLLLFGKDPQRFVRGAEITAVRFAGAVMGDTFSRQDITGTLPDQLRRAETFLIDHLRKDVALQDKMERRERYEYPLEAARELVVNAVAHRDYSISGDGIRLYIFRGRMEVTSPGRLPGPVTIANIRDERFSRNPIIVQVLSDMGFIERLGYGVDRVIELMRQEDLRAPEFEETAGGFRVRLFNHEADTDPLSPTLALSPAMINLPDEYEGMALNVRQSAAIAYLNRPGNSRITNSELQRMYPDVHAETIRRDLADLVTRNILNKMGQKRGSYYVLRRDESVPSP
jgi:ATP-dependent DNA helicase RecG